MASKVGEEFVVVGRGSAARRVDSIVIDRLPRWLLCWVVLHCCCFKYTDKVVLKVIHYHLIVVAVENSDGEGTISKNDKKNIIMTGIPFIIRATMILFSVPLNTKQNVSSQFGRCNLVE